MTLRAIVGATELVRSLETKDSWGAKRRVGPVIDEFEGVIEAARRGEGPETSPRVAPCLGAGETEP